MGYTPGNFKLRDAVAEWKNILIAVDELESSLDAVRYTAKLTNLQHPRQKLPRFHSLDSGINND